MVAIFKTQYFQGLSLKNLTYRVLNDSIEYRIHSVPMINSTPPKSFFEMDTFAIDYTEDELMNKVAVFTLSDSQS